jgi:hypothetical protein
MDKLIEARIIVLLIENKLGLTRNQLCDAIFGKKQRSRSNYERLLKIIRSNPDIAMHGYAAATYYTHSVNAEKKNYTKQYTTSLTLDTIERIKAGAKKHNISQGKYLTKVIKEYKE